MECRTIGIVPIRAGSMGVSNKNIRPLAGKPLFLHALEQARGANLSSTVISTNIETVLAMALEPDVHVFRRSEDLAKDETEMADVLSDLLTDTVFDDAVIVLLQATSPLRTSDDILGALAHYHNGTFDLVMSVCAAEPSVLKCGTLADGGFEPMRDVSHVFSNRQHLPPVFKPNGAIYVFSAAWYRKNGSFQTDNIGAFEMSVERSLDIDEPQDFARCEEYLQNTRQAEAV